METNNDVINRKIDDFAQELAVALRRILEMSNFDSASLPHVVTDPKLQDNNETGDTNG